MELEFQRNGERYNFLKWAQKSFQNVRIVPPGAGICHQLNIEQFAQVAMTSTAAGVETPEGENPTVYFDTLVGTDSHTPTANGIGVLGWGVGGIEAEAAALGQPITTLVPKVVGVRLTGQDVYKRQGYGCSPFKAVRELGSERRETVRSLSSAGAGELRRAAPSTRGPGRTGLWCPGCRPTARPASHARNG